LEFLHQVYIGDTLNIVAVVKQVSVSTQSMVLSILAKNQNNQDVLKGESTVKILENKKQEKVKAIEEKKVCLITGGTSNIGSAVAENLAKIGFSIALNYNCSVNKAECIRDKIQNMKGAISIYKADVSNRDQVESMVHQIEDRQGGITAIVHCAAPPNVIQGFETLKWGNIQQQIDIQVKGLYNCMQVVLPAMVEKNIKGRIVCITSIAADDVPPAKQYDYVLAKAAMISLAKSLAVEYSPKKIAINLIAPGMTETERIIDLPQKAKLMTKMQSPSRSLIHVDEIAETVAFLLMQKSCAITGETVRVCGGIKML
jgi:3-oxoacyl-[acyl-carrier protein] reductase